MLYVTPWFDILLILNYCNIFHRDDGCFVARMIGMNSTDMVITDLLDCMWVNYRLREEPKHPEYPNDDEESKLLDKNEKPPLDFRSNANQ